MFLAFTAKLECGRPAFWLERTVTQPTVRLAGQELADHLVGTAGNKAWLCTAAVLGTEALALRGGIATCHGARCLLSTAVDGAMFKPFYCVGSAAIELALSESSMLEAKTMFLSNSIAPFHLALFLGVQVLVTPSLRLSSRGAPFPRAEPVATILFGMFSTVATCFDCRRPAFWLERTVTKSTVCLAG